jgi:hypothetical protein
MVMQRLGVIAFLSNKASVIEKINTLFLKYLTTHFFFNVGLSGAWAPYAEHVIWE